VPVPFDESRLKYLPNGPLPLSRPNPDDSYGYSKKAFTRDQLVIINLLVDESEQSYATPGTSLQFPFMSIEIKSQAEGGTRYPGVVSILSFHDIMIVSRLPREGGRGNRRRKIIICRVSV
jgi:hypothetical protein